MDNSRRFEDKRKAALSDAADRWIENEMWTQRHRRAADLHDLSAFVRGFNEGIRFAQKEILGKPPEALT